MPFALPHTMANYTVAMCVDLAWRLEGLCPSGHRGGWRCSELPGTFPLETRLADIAERLKCSTCGARDGRLLVLQDHSATRAKDRERMAREEREGRR